MDSIGGFASIGRVSVRMLRHYDAIGLLRPAEVDPQTGYRWYRREQLADLGRIVALRRLGFSLEEVRVVVHERSPEVLRERYLRRRAAVEDEAEAAGDRLRIIDARLRALEEGRTMDEGMELMPLARVRLAEATAEVSQMDQASIGPVIGPMFGRLIQALSAAGITPVGPSVSYYEALEDGVRVHAGFPVAPDVAAAAGWAITDLPAAEVAATAVHLGAMATIDRSWADLGAAIAERADLRPTGTPREVYLVAMPVDDQSGWVTRLEWPVERVPD